MHWRPKCVGHRLRWPQSKPSVTVNASAAIQCQTCGATCWRARSRLAVARGSGNRGDAVLICRIVTIAALVRELCGLRQNQNPANPGGNIDLIWFSADDTTLVHSPK